MWRQFTFGVILGVFVGLGMSVKVDVSMEQENAGFFLKPMFHRREVFSLNSLERPLVVTRSGGEPVKIQAKYGPFTAEEYVPSTLLQFDSAINGSSKVQISLDISAHVVSRTVTQERPQVSVLFHSSRLSHREQNKIKTTRSPLSERPWCVQMYAEYDNEETTSVCILSSSESVCVADVMVPAHWWHGDQANNVDIYYSYFMMDKYGRCLPSGIPKTISDIASEPDPMLQDQPFAKKPMRTGHTFANKIFVSKVTLTHGQVTYQELKEDQHILVYIPQKSFYPGSKFTVPIKLQAESNLQIFVIKVKARHGIRIVDAIPSDSQKWMITMELNHKNKGAMVTASVADVQKYSKTDRVQNIFDFVFEVEDGATGDDRGRLSFTLAYEMNTLQRETYGSVENKVVARLDIQQDNTIAIVPVIKSSELINTAMLTGKVISIPMRIYSIRQGARITDVTSTTTCHSGDENVLKVAQSCNLVYMDGSEKRGSVSVSIIAKFGRHSEFLFFKVWAPQFPLDIYMSDEKLSQIKGWKVPIEKAGSSRQTRGVDFGLLTHPDLLFQDDGLRKEDLESTCQLRYQQAEVEVYAHFILKEQDRIQYYTHKKAMFRVTEHVLERLRVADTSIAKLTENIVKGLKPGRTEIQVVTRKGRVIGAHEVRVGQNKVTIEKLEVDVVSGISLTLDREPKMDGVLKANVHRETQLKRNYQEGFLDIKLWFDDGTSTPLHQVAASDYMMKSDSLYNHIVAFGPQISQDEPRVIALGPGKGEYLKVSLELRDACQRKKSRNIGTSYVYININFSDDVQNDPGYDNRVNEKYGPIPSNNGGSIFISKDIHDQLGKSKGIGSQGSYDGNNKPGGIGGINLDDLDFEKSKDGVEFSPNHEAQQQLVLQVLGMTPLEIGMYVLLAIFCMAIVVFMVNCMIFVARYKRKRSPPETKDPIANVNDWVWIGRATLERNAISTTCSQALMSDADFNGNHNNVQYLSPPETTNNVQASAVPESSSNRNSVISTYKGSECSIRITTNPLPDDPLHTDDDVIEEDSTSAAPSTPDQPNAAPAPAPAPASASKPSEGGQLEPIPPPSKKDPDQAHPPSSSGPDPIPPPVPPHATAAPDAKSNESKSSNAQPSHGKSKSKDTGSGKTKDANAQLPPLPAEVKLKPFNAEAKLPPLPLEARLPPFTAEARVPPSQSRGPERASVPAPLPSMSASKPPSQQTRASCPGSFGFSSDSDDQCSLGRDYFGEKEPLKPRISHNPDHKSPEGACALDKDFLRQAQREALQVALAESIKAQQDSANGNVANGNISEAEWDYEVMGLTYDQLLDYFDNLKESTA